MSDATERSTPQKRIYLDFAAATPLDRRVKEAMDPYWIEACGNAGALHKEGLEAKEAIDRARNVCAECIGAHPDEIIFTSGGTEGNTLAVIGLVRAFLKDGARPEELHVLTSPVEHSSVSDSMRELGEWGVAVEELPTDADGLVSPEEVKKRLRPETVLISVMYVNNEIGTVMPIAEIAKVVRHARKEWGKDAPYLHIDACQAPVFLSCRTEKLGIDLMTIDAQKLYGPKGSGFLFRRRTVPLAPILFGGKQEGGLRPGTPVTPFIVGLARAFAIAEDAREDTVARLTELRDYFIAKVEQHIPEASLNGSRTRRVANNINFSIPGIEGQMIVLALDARGIAATTRSACLLDAEGGSQVVRALGKGEEYALSTVRFSLGRTTTREEIDAAVAALEEVVALYLRERNIQELERAAASVA